MTRKNFAFCAKSYNSVEKGSLIINVEDIDEKDVMPISTDAIASGSVASGNKPQ